VSLSRSQLRQRALGLLAQREHSRSELRRKLARADAAARDDDETDTPGTDLDALLDDLAAQGLLSEARFVESRLHARADRFGNQRIRQELARHGLSLSAEQADSLRATELARAREVWRRRFGGEPPQDLAQRAKQARFLSARGFSPEVISRVLRGGEDD
jgi:regulatory protein